MRGALFLGSWEHKHISNNLLQKFRLDGRVVIITGGAGFLGEVHAEAVSDCGGIAILLDRDEAQLRRTCDRLLRSGKTIESVTADVTSEKDLISASSTIQDRHGRIDGLVNNAAINPQVEGEGLAATGRFEDFSMDQWNAELAVTLTGAFLCCQIFGGLMARSGRGSIVNIASDLAVISPDNRLYWEEENTRTRSYKPVSYSVAKTGLIGLTRYLSTYWAEQGVRVNALSPGGVLKDQNPAFLNRIATRIPLGRLADRREYQGALVFLLGDASSYITGINLIADGGRSVW